MWRKNKNLIKLQLHWRLGGESEDSLLLAKKGKILGQYLEHAKLNRWNQQARRKEHRQVEKATSFWNLDLELEQTDNS